MDRQQWVKVALQSVLDADDHDTVSIAFVKRLLNEIYEVEDDNVFSSQADTVDWQDHGSIQITGSKAPRKAPPKIKDVDPTS